jgi:hypothetical protein
MALDTVRSKWSRLIKALMLAAFGFWYISFAVRWLSAFAWPYGRLVMITEDSHESELAFARIIFGFIYAILVALLVLLPRLSVQLRIILLALLLVPPLMIAIHLGLTCDNDQSIFNLFHCSGNKTVLKFTIITGLSGVVTAFIPFILLASKRRI